MSVFVKQMKDSIAVENIAREIFYCVSFDDAEETFWQDLDDDDKTRYRKAAAAAWIILNDKESEREPNGQLQDHTGPNSMA